MVGAAAAQLPPKTWCACIAGGSFMLVGGCAGPAAVIKTPPSSHLCHRQPHVVQRQPIGAGNVEHTVGQRVLATAEREDTVPGWAALKGRVQLWSTSHSWLIDQATWSQCYQQLLKPPSAPEALVHRPHQVSHVGGRQPLQGNATGLVGCFQRCSISAFTSRPPGSTPLLLCCNQELLT